MIVFFLRESGFGIMEVFVAILLAFLAAFGVYSGRNYVCLFDMLDILQKAAFVLPFLGSLALHLKLKLMELTGRSSLSNSEQRRLSGIASDRIKTLSFFLFFYIITAIVLVIGPTLKSYPKISLPMAIVGASMFAVSIFSGAIIAISYHEMADFKMLLDRREAEANERERLLKKLSESP